MNISKRGQEIQASPIRKLKPYADEAIKRGIHVYFINIGQPDIPTPQPALDAFHNYEEKVLSYGPAQGFLELRQAIAEYFGVYNISLDPENVIITTGGSEAIHFSFSVVADPGEEIIIPEPFYTNYNGYASFADVKIVPLTLNVEDGFRLHSIEEIEAFCRTAKDCGKLVTVHLKSYGKTSGMYSQKFFSKPHNLRALKEMLNIARQTGVRLQISHILFSGRKTWPTADNFISLIEDAYREGIDVMGDAFPYTYANTTIDTLLPPDFIATMPESFRSKRACKGVRYGNEIGLRMLGLSYEDCQLMNAPIEGWEDLSGQTITEVAKKKNESPIDIVLALSEKSKGAALMLYHALNSEKILEQILPHDLCLFGTDAIIKSKGYPNPAALGSFPKILGHYVRDRKLISLEKAIQKITSGSAKRFGIKDRGILKPGMAADIVIFNQDTISEIPPINSKPASRPTGIQHVFINGTQVVKDGEYISSIKAGKILRL